MATFRADKTRRDIKHVSQNVKKIFNNKEASAFALAAGFAVKMHNQFKSEQAGGKYWKNQTQQAKDRLFTGPFKDSSGLGFFIAHGVDYGVYLELANNRKNAALLPLVNEFAPKFVNSLRELY